MPSPFPGMDPYLENPAWWPTVHNGLITFMWSQINALLPKGYVANIGERLYVVQPDRGIYPDVAVLERSRVRPVAEPPEIGVAVAVESDSPWMLTVRSDDEVREVFVEIVPVGDRSRVITVVEVLSPSNKVTGSEGRRLYREKQREVLSSPTHLLEIDLLQSGEHSVAAPLDALIRRGVWNYLVSLSRGGVRDRWEVWAITLRQRLPRIRVPLADGDPDIVLDLQSLFDRVYDEGAFVRRLDYSSEPPVPWSREDAEWVDELFRQQGLRT